MSEKRGPYAWLSVLFLTLSLFLTGCRVGISLHSPSASPVVVSPGAQEAPIAQAVFRAINKDRASAGLSPLRWSDALARSAGQHNRAMMTANRLAHQLPGESDLGAREREQGVAWLLAAENVGVTSEMDENGALRLHRAMMAEKPPDNGHRRNILTSASNLLGVAVLLDSVHGELWLTEDFAQVV